MTSYHLTDDEWIESWKKIGSPSKFAKEHGIAIRNVMQMHCVSHCVHKSY